MGDLFEVHERISYAIEELEAFIQTQRGQAQGTGIAAHGKLRGLQVALRYVQDAMGMP